MIKSIAIATTVVFAGLTASASAEPVAPQAAASGFPILSDVDQAVSTGRSVYTARVGHSQEGFVMWGHQFNGALVK